MGGCGSKPHADVDKAVVAKIEGLQATVDALAGNLNGLHHVLATTAKADDVKHIISDIDNLREQQTNHNVDVKDKLLDLGGQNEKLLSTTEACSGCLVESNKLHVEANTKADELHSNMELLHQALLKADDQLAELQQTQDDNNSFLQQMAESVNTHLTALQSQLNRLEDKGVKLLPGETRKVEESVNAVSQQASQILAELFAYQRRLDNVCTTLDKVSIHASEAASFRQIDDLASDVQSLKSKLVKPARSPAKAAPSMTGWSRVHQDLLTKTHVVLDCKGVTISARASGAITLRNWSTDRTFYNKESTNSWVFASPSSSKASLSFCLKDTVPYEFSLVLTHLTAYDASNSRPGHAPIRVTINDTLLISDHDVSSFDYITERWVIPPGVLLPAGWENKVVLMLGPSASTSYWLQRLEVRPNGVYGQPNVQ